MNPFDPFNRALLAANPDDCRAMLRLDPRLATSPIEHAGDFAHPLVLLAQWPGRLPHHVGDPGFADRLFACAEALFDFGADLSARASSRCADSCAAALLSRMASHRQMDQAWGLPDAASPEALIMQASLSSPGSERAAAAWLVAVDSMDAPKAEPGPLDHFIALARSLSERSALGSTPRPRRRAASSETVRL